MLGLTGVGVPSPHLQRGPRHINQIGEARASTQRRSRAPQ